MRDVASAKPAPVAIATAGPLDDPNAWLQYAAHEAPLPLNEIQNVQTEIDGIIGTTRENKSIAKLVWNGDRTYWKKMHNKWDAGGHGIGDLYERPQVLYMTIRDENNKFVRDAFVPRWLIMTRLEPEQYAGTWVNDSRFFDPDLGMYVQLLPSVPPTEQYIWFMTIAVHVGGCCQRAASQDMSCYGRYAHPRQCLDELRNIRKGLDEGGFAKNHPFDSPDRISRKVRARMTNNYEEQAVRAFRARRAEAIEETPLALATTEQRYGSESIKQLRETLKEQTNRDEDQLVADLKNRRLG